MNDIRMRFFSDHEDRLKKAPATGWALREVADKAKGRVSAPKDQTLSVRAGVGPRGAFSQVIMRGPRATFIEFGTFRQRALAPLRSAIFAMKGVRR